MNIKSINKVIVLFFLILILFFSCQKNSDEKKVKVNFSNRENIYSHPSQSRQPLRAAVSAMVSPEETFFYYTKIFDYISSETGKRVVFKQRKSYQEVNELLRHQELDFAFICSGAYVEAKKDFNAEILAIPQIKGKTNYHAYIIVHNDSNLDQMSIITCIRT